MLMTLQHYNLNLYQWPANVICRKSRKIYNSSTKNTFGLLEKEAKQNEIVKIISIPTQEGDIKPDSVCSVLSWGRLRTTICGLKMRPQRLILSNQSPPGNPRGAIPLTENHTSTCNVNNYDTSRSLPVQSVLMWGWGCADHELLLLHLALINSSLYSPLTSPYWGFRRSFGLWRHCSRRHFLLLNEKPAIVMNGLKFIQRFANVK
ncbi:granzyme 1 [Labeo rohita]|uniref:Granzyme 1 n=1 Tax=Labeo rohita TaxID=84645 RepID=A0A498MRH1_LABRO|nr:granzyme 1 [Labeo rohita]